LASEKRSAGEKIVIVIDALDQAGVPENMNALGLPGNLPQGVYFIVSTRPVRLYLTPEAPHQLLRLRSDQAENRADLRQYLQTIPLKLTPSDTQALLARCGGVWVYLRYILQEIEAGSRTLKDLSSLPNGLTNTMSNIAEMAKKKSGMKLICLCSSPGGCPRPCRWSNC
jgi:hypothetical protein